MSKPFSDLWKWKANLNWEQIKKDGFYMKGLMKDDVLVNAFHEIPLGKGGNDSTKKFGLERDRIIVTDLSATVEDFKAVFDALSKSKVYTERHPLSTYTGKGVKGDLDLFIRDIGNGKIDSKAEAKTRKSREVMKAAMREFGNRASTSGWYAREGDRAIDLVRQLKETSRECRESIKKAIEKARKETDKLLKEVNKMSGHEYVNGYKEMVESRRARWDAVYNKITEKQQQEEKSEKAVNETIDTAKTEAEEAAKESSNSQA